MKDSYSGISDLGMAGGGRFERACNKRSLTASEFVFLGDISMLKKRKLKSFAANA